MGTGNRESLKQLEGATDLVPDIHIRIHMTQTAEIPVPLRRDNRHKDPASHEFLIAVTP